MPESSQDLAINVENLCKSFHGKLAVDHVTLKIPKGEIFGFLGPNGSGKTTTIRMLCGLLTPDSGAGHCLGFDIIKQSIEIKAKAGYMPQRFSLYEDLTVEENLDFIARIYDVQNRSHTVNEILEKMLLTNRRNQLTGELSGGWKQRVALASALLHQPKLLLLDEPTGGVDPEARRIFWDLLYHLSREGITSLVSTHYMDEAERCNHLAYIAQGQLLVKGTPQEIVDESGIYTLKISGRNIQGLVETLETIAKNQQVVRFGNALHLSGKDKETLIKIIEPYKEHYKLTFIKPNLEDVFISLIRKRDKEKDHG